VAEDVAWADDCDAALARTVEAAFHCKVTLVDGVFAAVS
jgi:hypothetical protein